MYSDIVMYIMIADIIAILYFVCFNLLSGKRKLIHWLFAAQAFSLVIWQIAIIAMKLVDPDNTRALFLCDAFSNIGAAYIPVVMVLLSHTYTKGWSKIPKKYLLLTIPPFITILMVFTNPWHHLYYKVFAIKASDIVFGPYMLFSGAFSYFCLLWALVMILRYCLQSSHRHYMTQSILVFISILVPTAVNFLATFQVLKLSIAATPLAFLVTVICQGGAIYYFDFLNIEPLALERVLDSISDGYVVVDGNRCVVSYNKPFSDVFAPRYDLHPGTGLKERANKQPEANEGIIYNLLTSIESAAASFGVISYEQPILDEQGMSYYVVEVTPLVVGEEIYGYIAMFKDVTRLREAMRREQDSMGREMERERLASLGQMIGGISHNLKTPIMSVSGSVGMLERLSDEYRLSVGDPEVTLEDHEEIYQEMRDWLGKIKTCCAYMSDIITSVKGLAANMSTSEDGEIDIEELFKRVLLLMQHEAKRWHCTITFDNQVPDGVHIQGDINNLVQVINNLVGNAIDAMSSGGGGDIKVTAELQTDQIVLCVADEGPGVPPETRKKLFKEMHTSKGAKGTGLGLYISSALVHGKFGGDLWLADTERGARFCLSIPLEKPETDEK